MPSTTAILHKGKPIFVPVEQKYTNGSTCVKSRSLATKYFPFGRNLWMKIEFVQDGEDLLLPFFQFQFFFSSGIKAYEEVMVC